MLTSAVSKEIQLYIDILFHILFRDGSSQDNECSFPCSTVGPCFFLSYRSDFAFLILKYSHGRLFTPPTSAGRGPSLCVSLCRAPHARVCSLFPQTTQTLLHPTPPWVLLCFSIGFPSTHPNAPLPCTSQSSFKPLLLQEILAHHSTSKLSMSTYFVQQSDSYIYIIFYS